MTILHWKNRRNLVKILLKYHNDPGTKDVSDTYQDKVRAWKFPGEGGYLILISEEIIPNSIKVMIRY